MKINTLPIRLRTTLLAIIALSVLVTLSVFALAQNRDASAANASDFKPGSIISDAVFYNSSAMSASQIQSFLNARVPNCDTNGTGMAVEWGRPDISRATLASYIRNGTNGYTRDTAFHAPPYVCLKDFRQNTPQMPAASGLCGGISARTSATSAQIISDIARACGINPQVLLVLLQKEQSLVTDIWPLQRQYRGATGFACPDTAPCDPKYNGFFYQVYYAARQFKIYQAYPNSYNYLAGRSNRVYWQTNLGNYINPTGNQNDPSRTGKSACGYQNVYIQNQATAALYIYTPYQPNQRAMANLYGTGDFCSAYGNRNFWRMFTDWFGNTQSTFERMSDPRWMKLKNNTFKKNPLTNSNIDTELVQGRHILFKDRLIIDGRFYLRTAHDSSRDYNKGILLADLEELAYEPFQQPRWMKLKSNIKKYDPVRSKYTTGPWSSNDPVYFTSKIFVNGEYYYRTKWSTDRNISEAFPADSLQEVSFDDLLSPRYMQSTNGSVLYNLEGTSPSPSGSTVDKGELRYLDKKLYINGKWYAKDSSVSGMQGYLLEDFSELTLIFEPFIRPRVMQLLEDTQKLNPVTLRAASPSEELLNKGREIEFASKIQIDGTWYARSKHDTDRALIKVIPLYLLDEI